MTQMASEAIGAFGEYTTNVAHCIEHVMDGHVRWSFKSDHAVCCGTIILSESLFARMFLFCFVYIAYIYIHGT